MGCYRFVQTDGLKPEGTGLVKHLQKRSKSACYLGETAKEYPENLHSSADGQAQPITRESHGSN